MPSGVTAGDLLVVMFGVDGVPTVTHTGTGWTQYGEPGSQAGGYAFVKIADGADTLTVNYSVAEVTGYYVYRITGAHASTVPEADSDIGSTAAPDSPNLAPSWGSADTLWISFFSLDDGTKTISSYPTNYSDNQNSLAGTTAGVRVGVATRNLAASSENPGAFATSASDSWVAMTIAVRPAAGGGGSSGPTGLAAETDAGLALSAIAIRSAGLASSTELALALGAVSVRGAGLALEADSAITLAGIQSMVAGLSSETDTALALTSGASGAVGVALEADSAMALVGIQIRQAGLALESDEAFALGSGISGPVGFAAETDQAFALPAVLLRGVGISVEADLAIALLPAGAESTTTPAARSLYVPAEARAFYAPAENRSLIAPAEDRELNALHT